MAWTNLEALTTLRYGNLHLIFFYSTRVLIFTMNVYFILVTVPDLKHIYEAKWTHVGSSQLLDCIFEEIPYLTSSQLEMFGINQAIYDAIKHGIIEFIVALIKHDPESIWRKGVKGRTMFSHAVVLRQEKIFSLVYGLGIKKNVIARRHDIFHNNILHLAGKLSPTSQLDRVSGAALQMQRELQWFKVILAISSFSSCKIFLLQLMFFFLSHIITFFFFFVILLGSGEHGTGKV